MATLATVLRDRPPAAACRLALADPPLVRAALTALTLGFIGLFVFLPVVAVFVEAFARGAKLYLAAISSPEARAAIRLTLLTASIAVPLNVAFGVAAAWLIARFEFRGRSALLTLIDLPLSVSPVISGMLFVLLLGARTPLGAWLAGHGVRVIFAVPGIVLVTIFVTLPIAAREILPVMEAAPREEEEAALLLGGSPWQMFRRVTLANIRWGVIYGIVLSTARSIGEFGAVSVVSGHIRGVTNTMPLYVEILYNDYQFSAAFAVASLLTVIALATLVLKQLLARRLATAPTPAGAGERETEGMAA